MLWAVILAGGLITSPSPNLTLEAWLDWVAEHAPYGFDVTPDGTIWLNTNPVGQADDYAVRAADLYNNRANRSSNPVFWVRGYHKNNPKVAYRQSMFRYSIDCQRETISRSTAIYYDSEGKTISQEGASGTNYIYPGSVGAEYHRLFCIERG